MMGDQLTSARGMFNGLLLGALLWLIGVACYAQ